jgi:RNA polymerase sigma-70 factor, ECF subfamily
MTDTSKLSDEQLVKHVREQDKETYAEIINRYKDKLMRYALYLTEDDGKAADVIQESFIKAYINLNGFDIKKKFSNWIYRIVHNEAMNVLRGHQNKNIPILEDVDFDSGINIENEFIKKELQEYIHYCLGQMPVLYREPLSLYFLEDKSYDEISDILRTPIGTVGTRINRAKVLMKKICQKTKK